VRKIHTGFVRQPPGRRNLWGVRTRRIHNIKKELAEICNSGGGPHPDDQSE
jgi:hypothetical protein